MSINKSSDENVQTHTEAYYEELASEEEIYLEEMTGLIERYASTSH